MYSIVSLYIYEAAGREIMNVLLIGNSHWEKNRGYDIKNENAT
jgi:hypothetical protein